jgi:hypothetical protein
VAHRGLNYAQASFYIAMSDLLRAGNLRDPDPEIGRIHLTPDDIPLLRAFLRALTEDYS